MNWYHAADGKQSGPFTDEQFRALIADGTVQPATLVWESRLPNWLPLAQVPPELLPAVPATASSAAPPFATAAPAPGQVLCAECGKSFPPDDVIRLADRNVCAACKPILVQRLSEGAAPASVDGLWVTESEVLQREYRVEIGGCLERAWKAITSNLGPVIVSGLLFVLMMLAVGVVFGGLMAIGFGVTGLGPGRGGGGGLPSVPVIIGLVITAVVVLIGFMIASTVVTAGYSWFYLNLVRDGQANYGMIFEGFRRQFRSLLGALLFQTLISIAVTVPFSAAVQIIAMAGGSGAIMMLATAVLQIVSTALSLYLWAIWFFAMLLILDKRMRAWPAMQLSRKLVSKRIWMTLLFLLVAALLTFAGFLVCVIGLFVSVPLFLAMKAALYEDNFRDLQPNEP